ncbi:Metallo-dependent phosphatase [Laetiporus sulphureus 93-53]|uniref:Metallo-dependent phosphatase n=1 Tax=Laetiporus sulphureus 93-53 TaxID=1314785 RepID=A0A165EN43_9APHY|nr:Metallo-dependent phosphatase [Laetiporus sulphureus 93-53]KZT07407.1 Metallo-dependent phosphatase [Laetiporus sulphureus 93-53]
MALSLFRLGRSLRSIFSPAVVFIALCCLLTFVFVLYQPNAGPGASQRVGWQSWEVISGISGDNADATTGGDSTPIAGTPSLAEGVDWWNVTQGSQKVDSASLPLDVWDPMLPHDTGLSEIDITACFIDPWYAESLAGDFCAPATTKEADAYRGKWVRVPRNLNVQSGLMSLNIYYRRTRRHDIPIVTELRILPDKETPPLSADWHKVSRTISPSGEKLYLWYKTDKTLAQMTMTERQTDLVTELDVLFGDNQPWYGFEKLDTPVLEGKAIIQRESVWLTYRRGVKPVPRAPPLHFTHDGRFKIMQIADLHYSVSAGTCRDTPLAPCSNSDNLTNTLLGRMLDVERPDLVVFTGDQLNGQGTSWDARSVLAKFARAVTQRGIPWAAIFGNHDDEDGDSREDQIKYMKGLPYSLVEAGPKDIHGVGNYVLKVKSADASMTHLLTLYFLDSGSYSRGFFNWFGFFVPTEYDWIHQDQIDWFLQESSSIDPIERPFTPDSGKDLGDIWERQAADQVTPETRRLAKPNALMFYHIPVQETYAAADTDPNTGKPLDVGQHDLEGQGSPKKQDGFFHKGLLQAPESDHVAAGNAREVKVVANGHCHVTENCRRVKGVWLCFGGGGSYSGYGRVGFDRRFRIFDISDYGETIRTYKRTENDEIVDEMVLAGRGAPPPFEGLRR